MTQNQWSGALIYIYNHLFKNTSILRDKTPLDNYNIYNNKPGINNSNCNRYDLNTVNALCDYYCYLCTVYDKEISIMGFHRLTGISTDVINTWGEGARTNKLSTAGYEIWKKLNEGREESLVAKLVSNKNPVATIAILNKHFGYNMPGVRQNEQKQQIGTIDDIKQLMIGKNDNTPID